MSIFHIAEHHFWPLFPCLPFGFLFEMNVIQRLWRIAVMFSPASSSSMAATCTLIDFIRLIAFCEGTSLHVSFRYWTLVWNPSVWVCRACDDGLRVWDGSKIKLTCKGCLCQLLWFMLFWWHGLINSWRCCQRSQNVDITFDFHS